MNHGSPQVDVLIPVSVTVIVACDIVVVTCAQLGCRERCTCAVAWLNVWVCMAVGMTVIVAVVMAVIVTVVMLSVLLIVDLRRPTSKLKNSGEE